MTDTQIKQNAEEYINKMPPLCDALYESVARDAYIAGAHSRDEEVESLQRRVSLWKHEAEVAAKELNELLNPWISVEDRLPDKLENDCTSDYVLTRIDGPRQIWYLVNKYDYNTKSWQGCNSNTTHWMPIVPL